MRRRRLGLISKHSLNQANSHRSGYLTAICSAAGRGEGGMEGGRRRESCSVGPPRGLERGMMEG